MQVTRATFIPLLTPANSDRIDPSAVRDEYNGELAVVYTFGPQFGRRIVTHADLEQLQMTPRALRRAAYDHLEVLSSRAELHGQPPALMLSFDGLESSLLLATDFWQRLQGALPGELVVGVPARDVVIITGSQSQQGLEKARRCVERIFFAGDENLLYRGLLVRRGTVWEPFDRPARPAGRPNAGPAHKLGVGQPPRQYQEHPSWPGERVAPMRPPAHRVPPAGRPVHAPAASMTSTGMQPVSGGMPPVPPTAVPATGLPPAAAPAAGAPGMPTARPTSPAGRPPVSPVPVSHVPHQRTPYPAGPHPDVAQAMQYSAVPFSAVPYSAMPYSAVPFSAVPYSAVPYSAVPNSGLPYSLAPTVTPRSPYGEGGRGPEKPPYRDDTPASAPVPRALQPDYAPVSSAPLAHTGAYREYGPDRRGFDGDYGRDAYPGGRSGDSYGSVGAPGREGYPAPAYPASWGTAPSAPPSRSEFRTGPRARFTT